MVDENKAENKAEKASSTGRIPSTVPEWLGLPPRTTAGRVFRAAPATNKARRRVLLDIDYTALEMRLLAAGKSAGGA